MVSGGGPRRSGLHGSGRGHNCLDECYFISHWRNKIRVNGAEYACNVRLGSMGLQREVRVNGAEYACNVRLGSMVLNMPAM